MNNIEVIRNIAGFSAVIGCLLSFVSVFFLSIKLRKKKWHMMRAIIEQTPEKFKDRARFLMESNMSWLIGSLVSYTWFGYPMMRYLWSINHSEITQWQAGIKTIFVKDYLLYRLLALFFNIGILGFISFVILGYLIE
ncbi:hypothetical protein [uncultured Shewanella sp.]|uniref:hypothetical protein n=1 Tax=uncultured Shewanella sp. TaxID=173975 RepID=UPI002603FC5D|nr:hypothetical protein [uncultured Shewanella sp.]